MIAVPDIEFELDMGTLGGRFTTVEGLLVAVRRKRARAHPADGRSRTRLALQAYDQLNSSNPFMMGDSSQEDVASEWKSFLAKLKAVRACVRVCARACVP
jgi:zinc finger protein